MRDRSVFDKDLGSFETLADSLRRTADMEELFWESAVSTGIDGFDSQIGGLRPGELTILASEDRFICAKLSQVFVESVGVDQQLPVIVVRLGCGTRDYSSKVFMANDPLNRGWGKKSIHLQKPDWSSLEQLMHAPIYIVQPIPGAGIEYVDQEVEKLVKSLGKVGLIVIDGIDHINIWANGHYRAENPGASWAEVSAKVKWMALTCRCPVIADTRIVNSNPDEGAMPNPTIWDLPYQGALAVVVQT